MRYWTVAALVLATATTALAQDPHRNRMNDSYPAIHPEERAVRLPDPFGNRMNVRFEESAAKELSGAPNPYANRMNDRWTPPAVTPKPAERRPVEPRVTP